LEVSLKNLLLGLYCFSLLSSGLKARTVELTFINVHCDIRPEDSVKISAIKLDDVSGINLSSVDMVVHFFSNKGLEPNSPLRSRVEFANEIFSVLVETAGLSQYFLAPSFFFSAAEPMSLSEIRTIFQCPSPNNKILKNMMTVVVELYDENRQLIAPIRRAIENESPFQKLIGAATRYFYIAPPGHIKIEQ